MVSGAYEGLRKCGAAVRILSHKQMLNFVHGDLFCASDIKNMVKFRSLLYERNSIPAVKRKQLLHFAETSCIV